MSTFQLTDSDLAAFEADGYVIVRGLFSADELAGVPELRQGDRDLEGEAYVKKDAAGGETRLALRNDLAEDSVYTAVVRSARVARSMERLLGAEVYHYHHKMIFKEPKVGGAWEWHQDYGYWYTNGCLYPDMGSCMIAVDQASVENGCLQVLRGSHKLGRVDHLKVGDQTGADPDRVAAAVERHELVHCEMEPGDAVFFHGNTLHRSDQNTSDAPRWALIACYNTKHNDPIIRNGRHPNYSPLEIWPDERVMESISRLTASTS